MKSIAALLLTIALALFPPSATRVMAAVQANGHGMTGGHAHDAHAAGHHHGAQAGEAQAAAVHSDAADADGQDGSANGHCTGDHGANCCSLNCHAMAPHLGVVVPTLRHSTMPVGIVALPLPRGIGFDGLLRPPRSA